MILPEPNPSRVEYCTAIVQNFQKIALLQCNFDLTIRILLIISVLILYFATNG